MSDSLDIENLLQAGYFKTSRARQPESPTIGPAVLVRASETPSEPDRPKPVLVSRFETTTRPPPPSVEDEAESLAREYGTRAVSYPGEEPQSRGDIDQDALMEEVHEHNPERRFVILENSSPTKDSGQESNGTAKTEDVVETSDNSGMGERNNGRPPAHDLNKKRESSLKVDEDRPLLERRKSRQDLPHIETKWTNKQRPHHHRSHSATICKPEKQDSGRESRKYGDTLLSPEIVTAGSGRREKAYHDYAQPGTEQRRGNDPRSGRSHDRRDSRSTSTAGRQNSQAEPSRSGPRTATERPGSGRYYDERSYPRSAVTRGDKSTSRSTDRRRESAIDDMSESSRNDEDARLRSRSTARRRRYSNIIEHHRDVNPATDKSTAPKGPRPMAPTMPLPPTKLSGPDPASAKPRSSATWAFSETERSSRDRPVSQPPYPADDDLRTSHLSMPAVPPDVPVSRSKNEPAAVVNDTPTSAPAQVEHLSQSSEPPTSIPATPVQTSQSWQPPSFDPERDGVASERPAVGSYRRHSESAGQDDGSLLPDCPRTRPVAGMFDWLTLPRTDFNICPSCYSGVFDKSEYRTHFKPLLRPVDRPIACDFGSSPWFRIAWLLTLKRKSPDLRTFHHIAHIMSPARNQPCPGDVRTVRKWFVVRDPETRHPVPEFTVCHQCAKTVEVLLPNMYGVFVPEARPEQMRSKCSLHFTPDRRQFVLLFDVFETISDKALALNRPPVLGELAQRLEKLSTVKKCREDSPVSNGYWHTMQFLPEFTVCTECFGDMVGPRLKDGSIIARNFYMSRQQLSSATCQLYSDRMRDIFRRACRKNDPKYLESKVRERLQIEADIQAKLVQLDRGGVEDSRAEEQLDMLVREWKKWE